MGRFFGKRWKIDGVTAGPISRHYPANGRYSVIFERDDAFLEQIEKINWAKPTIQRLSEDANEPGLPEGYGFKVVDIKYDNSGRHYTVELQTASQYLGDVNRLQNWRALPLRRTARSRRRPPPSSRRKARSRARPPRFRNRQPPFRNCVKPVLLLN